MAVENVDEFAREFQRRLARLAREHAEEAERHQAIAAKAFAADDHELGCYHRGHGDALKAVSYRFASLIKQIEPLVEQPGDR